MRILADKGLQRPDGPDPFAFVQPLHHENNEHHDYRDLHQYKQRIEVRHQINAFQIGRGEDRYKHHYPNPWRNAREQRGKVNFRQQDVNHRQEQVIKQ